MDFTTRTSFPLPSLPERVTWKVWERGCPHSFYLSLQLFWSALTRKLRGPGYEDVKLGKL